MDSFWEKLPKPFLALAPMEDVTDSALRRIVTGLRQSNSNGPHVCFTEFVNVDGIVSVCGSETPQSFGKLRTAPLDEGSSDLNLENLLPDSRGAPTAVGEGFRQNGLLQRLYFTQEERPLVAQIWGNKPENFFRAAKIIKELGFDGIDINMGCPQRQVMKIGGCAALIGDWELVKEIIQATCEGAGGLPVSVKTRVGKKKIMTEEWIGFLLEQDLAAITIHGRTVAELSKVPAHWEEIGKVVKMRDIVGAQHAAPVHTLIIGNGDVKDYEDAMQKVKQYGVDGVMIGRGIFQNPYCFKFQDTSSKKSRSKGSRILDIQSGQSERIELFRKHIELYQETWGNKKTFYLLRKFVKMYINGWEGAKELREKLMLAENYEELLDMLHLVCEADQGDY